MQNCTVFNAAASLVDEKFHATLGEKVYCAMQRILNVPLHDEGVDGNMPKQLVGVGLGVTNTSAVQAALRRLFANEVNVTVNGS